MGKYTVHVVIENKPGISDPEGETILNDLVLKGGYSSISKIRSGKILKFQIEERSKKYQLYVCHFFPQILLFLYIFYCFIN